MQKKDIRAISIEDLEAYLKEQNQPSFRAKQIQEWLWQKSASSFEEMTNLPVTFRNWLTENFAIHKLSVHQKQISTDRTIKSSFKLYDNRLVEGVLIPTEKRMTACVSSQVGCSLDCKFCATGYMKRERNLAPYEIYEQVVAIAEQAQEHYQIPLTNIVFMGMGEPL
ncbi:MAG: 23S rRNA (adenine(2503)-C(2))-methyltransferase RlmN, partial [Raineya sp.]